MRGPGAEAFGPGSLPAVERMFNKWTAAREPLCSAALGTRLPAQRLHVLKVARRLPVVRARSATRHRPDRSRHRRAGLGRGDRRRDHGGTLSLAVGVVPARLYERRVTARL